MRDYKLKGIRCRFPSQVETGMYHCSVIVRVLELGPFPSAF